MLLERWPATAHHQILHAHARHCWSEPPLLRRQPKSHKPTRAHRSSRLRAPGTYALQAPEEGQKRQTGIICQIPSAFNECVHVLQLSDRAEPACVAGCRALFIDRTGNTHSVYHPTRLLTPDGYWDEMAALPALVPGDAPFAILGLGAGSIARILHHFFPHERMIGWELDPAVVTAARLCMGLDLVEQAGCLDVRVGDALAMGGADGQQFAGILVDMFVNNDIIPELAMVRTWQRLQSRLAPGGRIYANLGCFERSGVALTCLSEVFGMDKVAVKYIGDVEHQQGAVLALTGPKVSEQQWQSLPKELQFCKDKWRTLKS